MNWIVHQSAQVRVWEQPHEFGRAPRPPRIFEIGTYFGLSLVEFSRMVPGAELHSLNILPEQVEGTPPQGEILPREQIGWYARSKNVPFTQHLGDSRHFDYGLLPRPLDVAFIDGRHELEYIENDTRKLRPLMASGGVLVWHDYSRDNDIGVAASDAIDEIDGRLFAGALTHILGTSLVYWVAPP